MNGGCALIIGVIIQVVACLVSFKLSGDGKLLLGGIAAVISCAASGLAIWGYSVRAPYERENPGYLKLTIHNPIGPGIWLLALGAVAALVYTICKLFGWVE